MRQDDSPLWTRHKWLLIMVFLTGCTVIYVTGDRNVIDHDATGTDIDTITDTETDIDKEINK